MAGLVRLKVFANLVEAQIVRATLEAHGIPAVLLDEHFSSTLSPVVGLFGVEVMVPEDCLDEAARLLETAAGAPERPLDDASDE